MYWHYLARDLGMSLRRVRQEVSSREFIKHIAFYQLLGRSEDNLEMQLATLNQMTFNINVDKKDVIKETEKFMIRTPLYDRLTREDRERQKSIELENKFKQFTQSYNVKKKTESFKERR